MILQRYHEYTQSILGNYFFESFASKKLIEQIDGFVKGL